VVSPRREFKQSNSKSWKHVTTDIERVKAAALLAPLPVLRATEEDLFEDLADQEGLRNFINQQRQGSLGVALKHF
jgi:hypothetical protein